jgi:WD40 repeat protein
VGERLRHDAEVDTAVFSADGARIVTASKDWTARIWDAKTGKPVGESLRHGDAICAAVFSGDGARIITASADKTARIWDVAVDLEARLPDWVPELAEALGGQCFNKEGVLVPPEKSIAKLRKELTDPSSMHALKGNDF